MIHQAVSGLLCATILCSRRKYGMKERYSVREISPSLFCIHEALADSVIQ